MEQLEIDGIGIVTIEKDVPPRRNGRSKWFVLVDKMEEGDSVLVIASKYEQLRGAIENKGYKALARRENETHMRVWKLDKK